MQKHEAPYWMALAHIERWGYAKTNALVVRFAHNERISIEEFFHLSEEEWKNKYVLTTPEVNDLLKAKADLPNLAFLAEKLLNEGYDIVPLNSPYYSPTLKANLKASFSPPVLYVKGNKQLMKESAIAIVGSRAAADISLSFTDNIAKKASKEYKVVVSGFAKGVDKQALESALKYKGQSIIVLPQGILTFDSGFKNYYQQIVGGDVLVLSTFFPKSPWRKELAMARNPIIYGLADEIYVAESSEKGGTWSGVMDGLKKKRKIHVRKPEVGEKNANLILIRNGAVAVDFNGNEVTSETEKKDLFTPTENTVQEPVPEMKKSTEVVSEPIDKSKTAEESIQKKILTVCNGSKLTAKEILERLNMNISVQKLNSVLKKMPQLEVTKKGRNNVFKVKEAADEIPGTLF